MKQSLQDRCLEYLKKHPGVWINASELGDKAHALPEHYKHDTTSRRLRELAEEGLIRSELKRSEKGKESVFYSYHPQERTIKGYEVQEVEGKRVALLVEETVTI